MKFNWGTGIFGFIIFFILAVIVFFIYMNRMDIDMVEDNYYEKELAYQDQIDKIKNTAALPGKVLIQNDKGSVTVRFPVSDSTSIISGTCLFYRPSDPSKDFTVPLEVDDSLSQVFDISQAVEGRWIIKLDWEMGGKGYYYEEGVVVEH